MRTKFEAFIIGAGFLAALTLLATWAATTGRRGRSSEPTAARIYVQVNALPAVVSKPACAPGNVVKIERVTWGVGNTQIDVTQRVNDLMKERGWFVPCKEDLQNDPKTSHRKTLTVEYTVDGKPAVLQTHAWSFVSNDWLLKNAGYDIAGTDLRPVGNTAK